MPVSKKRKKKSDRKPSGPPLSKKELATKKNKLTRRQILIYVFSALIILSFILSFIVGTTRTQTPSNTVDTSGNGGVLFTPEPGSDDTQADEGNQADEETPSETDSTEEQPQE